MSRWFPIAAALLLLAGYADLAAGGTALAATLLVLGYVAAIPAAILRGTVSGRQRPSIARLSR
jgi:hypothetical protein